jgi:DNA replication protein DnaC
MASKAKAKNGNPPSNHRPSNPREKILQYLESLKIKMSAEQLDPFIQQYSKSSHSIWEILERFLEIPAIAHREAAIHARIQRANFRTEATLESYDWSRNAKTIRPEPFLELATGEFIRRKESLIFYGLSGLGKSHLIESIGKKCCTVGYRVRYETSASLIEVLNQARAIKALASRVRKYCSYDLLIIDEFGFEKLERKEVPDALSLLYKVIDGRNRRSSTAVVTNVNMSDWTDYLGDPPMTMALLDRVMDRSIQIPFKGKSGREPIETSSK